MAKRKKSKRQHKLIGMKVYADTDADILAWWESIQAGNRSDVLRDIIRQFLGLQPQQRSTLSPSAIDLPELVEVRRDTRWIVEALSDMPAYLERVIHQVASLQPMPTHQARAPDEVVRQSEESLNDEQVSRRAKRMKKATW